MECRKALKMRDDYLNRTLSLQKRRLVEEHLKECERCTEEYNALMEVGRLAKEQEIKQPPQEYWESVVPILRKRMSEEEQPSLGLLFKRPLPILAPALVLAIIFLIGGALFFFNTNTFKEVEVAEDRGQRTEDRGQRTEDRGQKTAVISHQSSVISQQPAEETKDYGLKKDRGQRTEDRRQRTEDRGQKTEDRRQKTEAPDRRDILVPHQSTEEEVLAEIKGRLKLSESASIPEKPKETMNKIARLVSEVKAGKLTEEEAKKIRSKLEETDGGRWIARRELEAEKERLLAMGQGEMTHQQLRCPIEEEEVKE